MSRVSVRWEGEHYKCSEEVGQILMPVMRRLNPLGHNLLPRESWHLLNSRGVSPLEHDGRRWLVYRDLHEVEMRGPEDLPAALVVMAAELGFPREPWGDDVRELVRAAATLLLMGGHVSAVEPYGF